MTDNVWVCKQNMELEEKIIKQFCAAGRWEKVIWCDNELIRPKRQTSVEGINEFKLHKNNNIPKEINDKISKKTLQYIIFASRNSKLGGFEYDNRTNDDYINIFNLLSAYTYDKLCKNDISLVIFNRAPHYEGDYILYLLAKELNIKTLIMQQSLIPNKFFYFFDTQDFGLFNTSNTKFEDAKDFVVDNNFEKDLFYMKSVLKPDKKQKLFRDEYHLLKDLILNKLGLHSLFIYNKKKSFKKNKSAHTAENPDMNKNFIYFPLHLQPELTTSLYGGLYYDQLLAVEQLKQIIPSDWAIYLKENPKQNYFMRGPWFFERLSKMEGVYYLDNTIDTYLLMNKCKAVATITGTAGWEAVTGGKPVIIFGWGTWYKSLPGVFEMSKDFNLKEVIEYKIDHDDLVSSVFDLTRKMGDGIIYNSYSKLYPKYNEKNNEEVVITSLTKILYP
jgi:hypothetical protein